MPDDRALILDVLAGQTGRFRVLVERHQALVLAVTRAITGNGAQAEDMAQDAFVRAFERLKQFDAARGSFRGWLLAIARNRCRDAARRPASLPLESAMLPPAATSPLLGGLGEQLDRALAQLSPDHRLAFLLCDVYELPVAEVAALADVPAGTVKSRASRARDALRNALGPLMEEPR